MATFTAFIFVLIATIISAFGSLYFKKGSAFLTRKNPLSQMKNFALFKGVALYAISVVFYIMALKGAELSIVYPMVATTYIWITFLSMKFLNEKMNKEKLIGIFLIILGVSLIGLGNF